MKRQLILHCGPMKTGSTAIQDSLRQHRVDMLRQGITYYHIPAKNLYQNLENALRLECSRSSPIVLLSSEFFGQMNPLKLREILRQFHGSKHAFLIWRPFRDVYPSLYLQNLKGSSRRTTSFRAFLENQLLLDQDPSGGRIGQVMNAPVLNARLRDAGCKTHWICYTRDHLIKNFLKALESITGRSLAFMNQPLLPVPLGLSPRRSLRMELAGIARLINILNRRGVLSDDARKTLLILLLDLGDQIKRCRPSSKALSEVQRERCDELDFSVNHQFLVDRSLLELQGNTLNFDKSHLGNFDIDFFSH